MAARPIFLPSPPPTLFRFLFISCSGKKKKKKKKFSVFHQENRHSSHQDTTYIITPLSRHVTQPAHLLNPKRRPFAPPCYRLLPIYFFFLHSFFFLEWRVSERRARSTVAPLQDSVHKLISGVRDVKSA